jgi:UPF0755 protein
VKRFLRILAIAFGLIACAALGAAGWVAYVSFFDRSLPNREIDVIVPDGATATAIARQLRLAGIVRSTTAFRGLVRLRGLETSLRAGEYRFPAHQTMGEVVDRLGMSGQQVAVWVTFPEGYTAREIAAGLAEHHLGDEGALADYFLKTPLDVAPGIRTVNLEGYLFPDTYLMPLQTTPAALAQIMTDQFKIELPKDAAARAKRLKLSIPEIVTLASLIEREAKADDERRLMAGVYYNRLRLNMPLQVDATLEYTFAHHKDVITNADLARDTPYNTYLHTGLPPTPIANPGRASLWAAFDPQPSDFLYYVYKGNGHHAFSRTLKEHDANVARYLH